MSLEAVELSFKAAADSISFTCLSVAVLKNAQPGLSSFQPWFDASVECHHILSCLRDLVCIERP